MLKQWHQEFGYCTECRSEHETISAKGKESLPLCDKENKCERIMSWHDGEKKHTEPFQIMPENFLAWELYYKIISLSPLQQLSWAQGKKQMTGYSPTLDMMDFVFKYYLDGEMNPDEIDLLIEKISLIHVLKRQYLMS